MSKEKSGKKGVSPSDAGQSARTAANKLRNISKAKAQRTDDAIRVGQDRIKGKPTRGTARAARRDAARATWNTQADRFDSRPLSEFCRPA
jgi:hypothetical protein